MCHPLRISCILQVTLPGLMIQVAGTPTHRVLVSVPVSAVVYTRILVSDRIGACPYRPFSMQNAYYCQLSVASTVSAVSEVAVLHRRYAGVFASIVSVCSALEN